MPDRWNLRDCARIDFQVNFIPYTSLGISLSELSQKIIKVKTKNTKDHDTLCTGERPTWIIDYTALLYRTIIPDVVTSCV